MEWFDKLVEKARDRARLRVAQERAAHPDDDEVDLARRLIRASALRAGLAGAATGTLALITLPVGLPAGIAVSLALEAELIFALLELYGQDTQGEAGRLKPYALSAGAGFADAAQAAGLPPGPPPIGTALAQSP